MEKAMERQKSLMIKAHLKKQDEGRRASAPNIGTRVYKNKLLVEEEEELPSPRMDTSTLKNRAKLVLDREPDESGKVAPLTMVQQMDLFLSGLSFFDMQTIAKFADLKEKAGQQKKLFEESNFRWPLLKQLADHMNTGSYKLARVRWCVVPEEIREKPRLSSSPTELDEALFTMQIQMHRIQQTGKDIRTMTNPMWKEAELKEAFGDENTYLIYDLPIHLGHVLDMMIDIQHTIRYI